MENQNSLFVDDRPKTLIVLLSDDRGRLKTVSTTGGRSARLLSAYIALIASLRLVPMS